MPPRMYKTASSIKLHLWALTYCSQKVTYLQVSLTLQRFLWVLMTAIKLLWLLFMWSTFGIYIYIFSIATSYLPCGQMTFHKFLKKCNTKQSKTFWGHEKKAISRIKTVGKNGFEMRTGQTLIKKYESRCEQRHECWPRTGETKGLFGHYVCPNESS